MKTRATRLSRFDSLEQEVYLGIWRTYDRLRMLEDNLFQGFELTAQQYNLLRLLQAEHPDSLPTLSVATRLVSRAPDITRMLDKLENRHWIERERPKSNRRVVNVRITTAGIELLQQIAEPLSECHLQQLGHLGTAQLKQLSGLLKEARNPHETGDSHWK